MPITFSVYGKEIAVNDSYDAYNKIRLHFKSHAVDAANRFMTQYRKYGNIDNFASKGYQDGTAIIVEIIEKEVVETLVQNFKVNHIDVDTFVNKYYHKSFSWEEYNAKVIDQYMEIKLDQQQLDAYRTQRRQSRGRVIGGGFGIDGAVKGMMTAGAMNLATGAIHGVFNLGGKVLSMIGDSIKKSSLYNSDETRNTLYNGIYRSVMDMHFSYWRLLQDLQLAISDMQTVPYLYEAPREKADAILKNMSKMSENEVLDAFPEVLLMNPYKIDLYRFMLHLMGDAGGELEHIGNFFGNDIAGLKQQTLSETYKKLGPELKVSEQKALAAKNDFLDVYKKLGQNEYGEKKLAEIDAVLTDYDIKVRTVDGILLETREEVNKAKEELFYIQGILSKHQFDESEQEALTALEKIKTGGFVSVIPAKYITLITERLNQFDTEARTANGILFDTREQKVAADNAFAALNRLAALDSNSLDSQATSAIVALCMNPVLLQSAHREVFNREIIKIIQEKLDTSNEDALLQGKDLLSTIVSQIGAQDAATEVMEQIDKQLVVFDEEKRSVACQGRIIVFETREKAAKARPDAALIDAAYQKFAQSPAEAKNFFELLENPSLTPEIVVTYKELVKDFKKEQSEFVKKSDVKTLRGLVGGVCVMVVVAFFSFGALVNYWDQWSWLGWKGIVGLLFLGSLCSIPEQIKTYRQTKKARLYTSGETKESE